MDFLQVCGLRRSIRIFRPWQQVEREKIQRILEVARLTTCPGNLQPWRAVVVERDKLSSQDREALLAADNYQGAHVQAPLWIYWFADVDGSTAETFRQRVHELVDLGALPTFYGWTHETIDLAIVKGETAPEGMPAIHTLIHNLPREAAAAVARQETVGVCAVATLAAVNEGLGTCLHMAASSDKVPVLKRVLKVPEGWEPVWCQLVGYPAEEREAGGQRPRLPFETIYFDGAYGKPFTRDPKVVEDLTKEGLLQTPMPKPGRFEELKHLARMLGFPL
ncbi:MAG TPA: nitroreductase family protein [Candidatus Binatia bacterium]|nr:nitroreductase family protein [Candidatus Binatia bacterium]